jgi:hypothetical protein
MIDDQVGEPFAGLPRSLATAISLIRPAKATRRRDREKVYDAHLVRPYGKLGRP